MKLVDYLLDTRSRLEMVLQRPRLVIVLVLAVTAVFAWHIPTVTFRASVYDLIIEDLPETARYRAFTSTFGSDEIIRVVVRADDVFDPAVFSAMGTITDKAGKIPGVIQVISLPSIKKTMDVTGTWTLKQFVEFITPVDLLGKNMLSRDHKAAGLILLLADDADKQAVVESVEGLLKDARKQATVYQIGMPLVSKALADYTRQDFLRLPPVTFVLIAGVLLYLFRSFVCLLLPMASVTITLVWTFGLLGWTHTPLSMTTMIVPVFLIAVGTAYCLYICSEYLDRAPLAADSRDAVLSTFSSLVLPTALAVLTTLVGLGSMLLNRVTGIREFALFTCFGMGSLLAVILTFFPAALAMFPLPRTTGGGIAGVDRLFNRIVESIIRLNLSRQRSILVVAGLIVVICGAGIFRLRVDANPISYFRPDDPIRRAFHDSYRDLSGGFPVNLLMTVQGADAFEDAHWVDEVDKVQRFVETMPGVDKTLSFADYLKLINYALNGYDPKEYRLPTESYQVRMLLNNFKMMLGKDMVSRFVDPSFSTANIVVLTHLSGSRDFLALKQHLLKEIGKHFSGNISWDVTGFGIVISATSDLITTGQIKSLSLILILVFLIMFLLFLSVTVGLAAIVPNLFPIVVTFGVMGWMGIELSMTTSLIAGIVMGLVVDDTIHYLVRYSREIKKDLNRNRALRDTLRAGGRPMIFSTFTISLGFAVLLFSHFQPTAIFGFFMIVALVSALLGDLIILPTLMLHVELVTIWDLLKMMKPLGGISADVVHELNQPLNAIKMGSDFLRMMVEQGTDVPARQLSEIAEEIGAQADRAGEIVNRLGLLERPGVTPESLVDLNGPVREVAELLRAPFSLQNIELVLNLDTVPPVRADEAGLRQVVYNLLANARDAIARRDGEGPRVIMVDTFNSRGRPALSVADTGVGIPRESTERVFEPFFTTRNNARGAGLGLSITLGIVKGYNGTIDVESEPGKGSIFTVAFPGVAPNKGTKGRV